MKTPIQLVLYYKMDSPIVKERDLVRVGKDSSVKLGCAIAFLLNTSVVRRDYSLFAFLRGQCRRPQL